VSSERWDRLEQLFAEALALPIASRAAFLARACGSDVALRTDVEGLLCSHDSSGVLDSTPHSSSTVAPQASLAAGTHLGHWCIEKLIGRGGMGEVYLATRTDASFEQRAALKLLRYEAAGELQRFHAERRILAKLEHPGIARLLDGGMAADGRPYTVMEYVEGQSLTEYCRERRSSLAERLALFTQVCDAVAFAHRNLVIHRDLKPDNIVVNAHGEVKLLDFGIAKLLDAAATPHTGEVTIAPFTPDYAAPEQLTGQAVTTATDVYALGVLLFELLTDERPLRSRGLPSTQMMNLLLDRDAPLASRVAQGKPAAPVTARQLAGDLDAITAKCLRREAAHRYETVNALRLDIARHVRNEPVLAREGARLYVFGRLLRRYRWAVAATAMLIFTLAAGLAGTIWQSHRAQVQAARATATKDFLLSVFRASDPRIASDKPRAQITAKELLDLAATRIEKDFVGQPELQIELLGLTSDIYEEMADEAHYAALQKRRIELARAHYGSAHPIVINGLLKEGEAATYRQDYAKANQILSELDQLLHVSAQDDSLLRADWWRVKARSLQGASLNDTAELQNALNQAAMLYAKLAPGSNKYAAVLNMMARYHTDRGEHVLARQVIEQALQVAEAAPDRDDALIAGYLNNLARKQERLGEFVAAENSYERAEQMARKTYGEHHATYWVIRAYHARMLHMRGARERAHVLFDQMLALISPDWKTTTGNEWARGIHAACMAAEGRVRDAIPQLEATVGSYTKRDLGGDLQVWRAELGDAYSRVGRTEEARVLFKLALDETLAEVRVDSNRISRVHERWGRFLLDYSKPGDADFNAAELEFRTVLEKAADGGYLELALAHAGLSRIAAARNDIPGALDESRVALATLDRVQGLYDIRVQPKLWLVRSAVLLKSGDATGARQWADKALQASRHYDDPSSSAIADAERAVRLATIEPSGKGADLDPSRR
jgi:tetratricopeptide (TPR) repeat protein